MCYNVSLNGDIMSKKKIKIYTNLNEIIKLIGEGGMGKVYLVKEVSTGKLMALKTVKENAEINEMMNSLFISGSHSFICFTFFYYLL